MVSTTGTIGEVVLSLCCFRLGRGILLTGQGSRCDTRMFTLPEDFGVVLTGIYCYFRPINISTSSIAVVLVHMQVHITFWAKDEAWQDTWH